MKNSERNRVFLQHPSKENELLPAQLLKEDGGVLSVRLMHDLLFTPNTQTRQFFHDQHDLFYAFSCQVLRMESAGDKPVVSVIQTGPKERHEGRETFRVTVYDDIVTSTIDGKYKAAVFDVGYGGLAAVIESAGYVIDAWMNVELTFDCKSINGRMQVRNRTVLKDGRYRYGLMVDPNNAAFKNDLENITHALQKIKARRLSRIGFNSQYANQISYPDLDDDADGRCKGKAAEKPEEFVSPDGTKRRHVRKNWNGVAKVFVLEDRQVRVLEVNTLDLSQGGLSFTSRHFIYVGTEILFQKPVPGGEFRICAKVCSSHMLDNGTHRVGVKFTGPALKPGETHPDFMIA